MPSGWMIGQVCHLQPKLWNYLAGVHFQPQPLSLVPLITGQMVVKCDSVWQIACSTTHSD